MEESDKNRAARKILYYWAVLKKAGYRVDEPRLRTMIHTTCVKGFDPGFSEKLRLAAYHTDSASDLPAIGSLDDLLRELDTVNTFRIENPKDKLLISSSKKPIFEADDRAILDFLFPKSGGAGPAILRAYHSYHDANATDFTKDILDYLDDGQTVILDLGNAQDTIRQYFSNILSAAVFAHQEEKFVSDTLYHHFVQLYFEEAHNLFPATSNTITDIYSRFAKEGAKFHIGMVYSTQSPSTISKELLAQTENFFVGHLSSQDEAHALARLQIAFDGIEQDILKAKTPGFMRMLTMSNRFVVPVQAKLFEAI